MTDYQDLILKTFSNKHGEDLLEFWMRNEVARSASLDASNKELRYNEGRKSLIIEIINVLESRKSN